MQFATLLCFASAFHDSAVQTDWVHLGLPPVHGEAGVHELVKVPLGIKNVFYCAVQVLWHRRAEEPLQKSDLEGHHGPDSVRPLFFHNIDYNFRVKSTIYVNLTWKPSDRPHWLRIPRRLSSVELAAAYHRA